MSATHDPCPPSPATPSKPVGITKPSATKPRSKVPSIAQVKYFLKSALRKKSQENLGQVLTFFRSGALPPDISCYNLIIALLDQPHTQHIKQEFQTELDKLLQSTRQPSPEPSYPPTTTPDPTTRPTSPSPPASPIPTPHLDLLKQILLDPPDRYNCFLKPQQPIINAHIDNRTCTLCIAIIIRLSPSAPHINYRCDQISSTAEESFNQEDSTHEDSPVYRVTADRAAKYALDQLDLALQGLAHAVLTYLNRELQDSYDGWRKLNELDTNVQAFRTLKRLVLSEKYGALYGCKVLMYGSATTGLGLPGSDVDISLLLPDKLMRGITDNDPQKSKRTEVLAFLMHCANAVGMRSIDLVSSARVPVLRYRDPKANVDVDVTLGGEDPTLLSRLFRRHMQEDERVWQLCMTVKYWAKRRMVSGVLEGCINAMGWCIMVIFFLQHVCSPPIAGLFRVRGSKQRSAQMRTIVRVPWKKNVRRGKSEESAAELLIRFFEFFGETFDFQRYAITLNCHSLIDAEALRRDQNAPVFIEQPLRFGENVVGHVSHRALRRTRMELLRAYKECVNGSKLATITEEGDQEARDSDNWMFDDNV